VVRVRPGFYFRGYSTAEQQHCTGIVVMAILLTRARSWRHHPMITMPAGNAFWKAQGVAGKRCCITATRTPTYLMQLSSAYVARAPIRRNALAGKRATVCGPHLGHWPRVAIVMAMPDVDGAVRQDQIPGAL